MHRAAALALLLGSTTLVAQSPSPAQSGSGISSVQVVQSTTAPDGSVSWTTRPASHEETQRLAANLLANSCPVALHARQSADAFRREVANGGSYPKSLAQHLHLTASNPAGPQIVAAKVTVRGFADKARALAAGPAQDDSDAAQTVDVKFAGEPGHQAAAELTVPGFSAVTAIELNSVTYADGSTWKIASGSACRSPIDGFMLIGAR